MAKDYYSILGISKDATTEDVRKAYKKLAKKYHPDVNKDSNASEKFKEVNEAAAILGNPEKRERYDQYGTADEQNFSGFDFREFSQGFNFDDVFESFFQGFGGGRRGGSHRGRDLLYEEVVTLEDAFKGVERTIRLKGIGACEDCEGTGAHGGTFITCPSCKGHGRVARTQRTPFGVFQMESTCSTCHGAGKKPETTCRSCHGDGKSRKEKEISVKIPRGAYTGLRLRVSGAGEVGERGGPQGDLFVQLRVQEHSSFQREDDNLSLERNIPFTTAILGGEITVPTIQGETTLKISQGTQPGTTLRVKGEGMPSLRGGVGDLYITLTVELPSKISKKQEELLKEFEHSGKKKGWFG